MSDSDKPAEPTWPAVERRRRARRTGVVRPAREDAAATDEERRASERRSGLDHTGGTPAEAVPPATALSGGLDPAADLVAAATATRLLAQARYSHFRVGAALETAKGAIITGCNIENASYGLTLCAERVALVKALSDGHAGFTRMVVVADTVTLTPPCGPCRQLLWEYCGDLEIVLVNLQGDAARYRLSTLLPLPFDGRLLE